MKKIFTLFVSMLMSANMWAAKAYPMPVTVTQSDGTSLTVIAYGDEDFNYYTTVDGVLLYHEGKDFFVASIGEDGMLQKTAMLAHEAANRKNEELSLVKLQDKSRFYAAAKAYSGKARMMREPVKNDNTLFPHTGTPKVLVILAQFSDVKFTVNDTYNAFNQYLNAEGALDKLGNYNERNFGSVKQYFTDMSFGAFSPQFDIYGPVTLDHPVKYYGENSSNRTDINTSALISDACSAVDGDVNFADYDRNGDGYVDLVYVIYAGFSESWAGNSADYIWPKSGTTNGGTYDGKKVYRYGVNNELNGVEGQQNGYINGIGLFCHEFSHCLGLPDLYVTTSAPLETQQADNQEMEFWSVMDSGTYLGMGYTPAAYTAWEREAFGWMNIETLSEAALVELTPLDKNGKAYRIKNDNDPTGHEYYIVENIQTTREDWNWNYKQYGHGMLVVHVDYNENKFTLSNNSVNNELGHPRMTVIAADGKLLNSCHNGYDENGKEDGGAYYKTEMAGDPFPGTSAVHELTDNTAVKPIVYNGSLLGKPIYDIQENTETGVVTFKFLDPEVTSVKDAITEAVEIAGNRIYTLDGRYIGANAGILNKGMYIINNKKVVVK